MAARYPLVVSGVAVDDLFLSLKVDLGVKIQQLSYTVHSQNV